MALTHGDLLHNRYRIVRLLGQGGFGAVYRAWDTNLNGPCAVKENFDTSPAAQAQFAREASLLFNLRHPNLPRVFDSFTVAGQGQYLVMDYIEGEDLARLLERSGAPLDEAQALAWIGQVCAALSYLHAQNPAVIHRDLKPANIRITPQGQAMLVDFGIAKVYDPTLKTTVGARAVTPGYSPPEQYGLGTTDAQSDVYALGATLYALLTCREPPASVDIVSGAAAPLEAAQQVNPAVSAGVSAALQKAMRLNRAERYGGVAEFWEALQAGRTPTPTPALPLQRGGGKQAAMAGAARGRGIPWKWVLLGLLGLALAAALVSALVEGSGGAGSQATQMALALEATLAARLPATMPSDATPARSEPVQTLPPTLAAPEGMVLIPAGEFQMGSESGDNEEKPVHSVYLNDFYVDMYETTNARYAECVAAGACDPPIASKSSTRSSYYGNPEYADYPVTSVTWEMADRYCQWRGGRLPTEAEWEKAARGGLEGKQYPWGDDAPTCERVNYGGTSGCVGDTGPAGSYAPNGYGLYDMAGNVWEWVQDWYSGTYYASSPRHNPPGPASGELRVLRGGGWAEVTRDLRSAYRNRVAPSDRSDNLGVRCVRSMDLPVTPMPTDVRAALTALPTPTQAVPGGMALIPAGEFHMGSESGDGDEKPVHSVYLDDFYVDVYETTNARYAECVAAGACQPPTSSASYTRSSYYGSPEYADYPVIYVTWEMANTYCQWRGGRLPTEAEWEKAARGGLEGRLYPWGDELPVCQAGARNGARFDDNAGCKDKDTAPVGRYAPNGYGLYDVAGNVYEWVQDWHLDTFYSSSPRDNPGGPESGQYRVLRGGSWYTFDRLLRVTDRYRDAPADSYDDIGLRCAQPASAAEPPEPTETPASSEATAAAPLPTAAPTRAAPGALALIPAGEFQMGSDSGDSDEAPVHTVYLDAYYLDLYEVTNALYAGCVTAGRCTRPACGDYGDAAYTNHPVVCVDWSQAQAYCQWRGGRLPTEAEWEKAARGGLEGKQYPWGDEAPTCEKGAENGAQQYRCGGSTLPAGSFAPNGYGLYDMAGNVAEWVQDRYLGTFYSSSPARNPLGPDTGQYRLLRGGGWIIQAGNLRLAFRYKLTPDVHYAYIGFRCRLARGK